MLTGKNKERFEEWYSELVWSDEFNNNWYSDMDYMSPSHQFGVYQDYADSIGYYITVSWIGGEHGFCPDITKDDIILWEEDFKTREKAIKAAIKAFDEIVNRELKEVE